MKFSIIIASYNRIGELRELLDSAERLDFPRDEFELVIADDGSADGTGDFIKGYSGPSGLNIRYLRQENKGPGEARNYGMREAAGTYFIFVDSDCMFPHDYLSRVNAHLDGNPLDAFGGPDTCHPSFSPLLKAINYSMTSFIGTGGTRGSKKSISKKFYPRSFNMGIHRRVFETIGGMNNLRHGQDMEFSSRIYRQGYKVGLIADAYVYHKRRTSLKRFFKQVFNWGVTRVNLGKADKAMLKPVHFLPSVIVAGIALLIIVSPLLFFFAAIALMVMWMAVAAGMLGIAAIAFGQSLAKYKQINVAFLSVITLYIQVFAYGAGLISGLFQSMKGRETVSGFSKNYYK